MNKIIVIGSGVSGITTALTLHLLGYDTEIYTDKVSHEVTDKIQHPEFGSLYPSASVIPHSVYSDKLEELFRISQSAFYELRKLTFPGITIHRHYEVFENEITPQDYCNWMPNFQPISELDADEIPRRKESRNLHGWAFDCIFADWPVYFSALQKTYRQQGGTIKRQKLEPKDIAELPAEVIINCSGMGSCLLFDDPSKEQLVLQGHLLHKSGAPLITNANNEIVSYNYMPGTSVYADAEGKACDVYCYPRNDGWILGGSRQPGQLANGRWSCKSGDSATCELEGISFPQQILDLNNEILNATFGLSVEASEDLTPAVGYRYIRSRKNGLRLDQEMIQEKKIYHNYGHGGAGVTLSWGCAFHIAKKITSQKIEGIKSSVLEKISQGNDWKE